MGRIILIPLDDSERSIDALQWALSCLVRLDDFVVLFHCYDKDVSTPMIVTGIEGSFWKDSSSRYNYAKEIIFLNLFFLESVPELTDEHKWEVSWDNLSWIILLLLCL
jgi:nucleotide-binding universal stress UspA family protein